MIHRSLCALFALAKGSGSAPTAAAMVLRWLSNTQRLCIAADSLQATWKRRPHGQCARGLHSEAVNTHMNPTRSRWHCHF